MAEPQTEQPQEPQPPLSEEQRAEILRAIDEVAQELERAAEAQALSAEAEAALSEVRALLQSLRSKFSASEESTQMASAIADLEGLEAALNSAALSGLGLSGARQLISSVEAGLSGANSTAVSGGSEYTAERMDKVYEAELARYAERKEQLIASAQFSWDGGYDAYAQAMDKRNQILSDLREAHPDVYEARYKVQAEQAAERVQGYSEEDKARASTAASQSATDALYKRFTKEERREIAKKIAENPALADVFLMQTEAFLHTDHSILDDLNKALTAKDQDPLELADPSKITAFMREHGDQLHAMAEQARAKMDRGETLNHDDKMAMASVSAMTQSWESFVEVNKDKTLREAFAEIANQLPEGKREAFYAALESEFPADMTVGQITEMRKAHFDEVMAAQRLAIEEALGEAFATDEEFQAYLRENNEARQVVRQALREEHSGYRHAMNQLTGVMSIGNELTYEIDFMLASQTVDEALKEHINILRTRGGATDAARKAAISAVSTHYGDLARASMLDGTIELTLTDGTVDQLDVHAYAYGDEVARLLSRGHSVQNAERIAQRSLKDGLELTKQRVADEDYVGNKTVSELLDEGATKGQLVAAMLKDPKAEGLTAFDDEARRNIAETKAQLLLDRQAEEQKRLEQQPPVVTVTGGMVAGEETPHSKMVQSMLDQGWSQADAVALADATVGLQQSGVQAEGTSSTPANDNPVSKGVETPLTDTAITGGAGDTEIEGGQEADTIEQPSVPDATDPAHKSASIANP